MVLILRKIKCLQTLYFQELTVLSINTFCPISPNFNIICGHLLIYMHKKAPADNFLCYLPVLYEYLYLLNRLSKLALCQFC